MFLNSRYVNQSYTDGDCCRNQPPVVGMAYVPWQHLSTVYEAEKGFRRGTLFPELDKPWLVGGGRCRE